MKPSTFTISDHIEAIRMFTTYFMYDDPRKASFMQNALPCIRAAKYIADNFDDILPSLSEKEADDLVERIDRAAIRMEEYKFDLLNQLEKEMENEDEQWD
jgi:hypothetical protein